MSTAPQKSQRHGPTETQSALIDVLLLDVIAQIESLLRSGRELQRELLRVRGVPVPTTSDQQGNAASRAHSLVGGMMDDSRALSKIVRRLHGKTNRLSRRVIRGR